MARLKAGMWVQIDGANRMILTSSPDCDGDRRYTQFPNTDDHWLWKGDYLSDTWPRSRRARWIRYKTQKSPIWIGYRHTFEAFYSPDGRQAIIMAGCRCWYLDDAREHYRERYREWLSSEENYAYNAWALAYLDRLEAHLKSVRVKHRRAA